MPTSTSWTCWRFRPTVAGFSRIDADDEVYRSGAEEGHRHRQAKSRPPTPRCSRCWNRHDVDREIGASSVPWSAPGRVRSDRSHGPVSFRKACYKAARANDGKPSKHHRHAERPLSTNRKPIIVAQAGVPGAVTIATNMAGRGTDIQLGGNASICASSAGTAPTISDEGEKAATRRKPRSAPEVAARCLSRPRHSRRRPLYRSAPNATKAAASTTSCAAAPAARAIPDGSKFFLSLQDDLMRIFGSPSAWRKWSSPAAGP